MRRTLRLFVCAAAMLGVAVGVAAVLKDDPGYEAGRSEISGKLVGLTEYQESRGEAAVSGSAAETARSNESLPAGRDEAPSGNAAVKGGGVGSTSAPFDTRPASVASEKTEVKAPAADKTPEPKSVPSEKEKADTPASSLKDKKPASGEVVKNASAPAAKERPAASRDEVQEKAKAAAGTDEDSRTSAPAQAEGGTREKGASADEQKAAPQYERVVTSAKFSMQGSQIKLVLQGNAPMVGHYFTLSEPDRVVLDLAGNWEIEVPRVPSNRLIQSVRVGQHDDKTRIVFDMKTAGKVALVPLNRNSLELRIQ